MVMFLWCREAIGGGSKGVSPNSCFHWTLPPKQVEPTLTWYGERCRVHSFSCTEEQSDGGAWWLQTAEGVFRIWRRETLTSSLVQLFGSLCSLYLVMFTYSEQCVDWQGKYWWGGHWFVILVFSIFSFSLLTWIGRLYRELRHLVWDIGQ